MYLNFNLLYNYYLYLKLIKIYNIKLKGFMSAINSLVEGRTLPYASSTHAKSPIIFGKVSRASEGRVLISTPGCTPWVNSRSLIIFGRVSSVSGRSVCLKPTKKVTINSIPEACIQTVFSFLLLKDRYAVNLTCKMWKTGLENLSITETSKISRVLESITTGLPVSFGKQKKQISRLMQVYKSVMHPLRPLFQKRDLIYKHALNIVGFHLHEHMAVSGLTLERVRQEVTFEFNAKDALLTELLKNLLKNPDVGTFIIQQYSNTDLLLYLPEDHPRYVDMALEIIKKNKTNIIHLKKTHPKYEVILYQAIKNDPEVIREIILGGLKLEISWNELFFKACQLNGMCLKHVFTNQSNYYECAVAAVRNNPNAVRFLPLQTLSSFKELIIEAVNKEPQVIHYVPTLPGFWNLFLEVCKKNPQIIVMDKFQDRTIELFQIFVEDDKIFAAG